MSIQFGYLVEIKQNGSLVDGSLGSRDTVLELIGEILEALGEVDHNALTEQSRQFVDDSRDQQIKLASTGGKLSIEISVAPLHPDQLY